MRLKKFISCIMLLMVTFLFYVSVTGDKFMQMEILSEQEWNALVTERVYGNLTPSLFFEGEVASYDSQNSYYLISQSMETNEWEGSLSVPGYEVGILEDEILNDKLSAIANGATFPLIVYNDDNYMILEVAFSGCPIMDIKTTSAVQIPIEGGEEDEFMYEYTGSVTVFNTEDAEAWIKSAQCVYNERGSTSLFAPKISYKVKLLDEKGENADISLLGLREDDDWILNPLYTDESKVRDKVSIDIWQMVDESNEAVNEASTRMEYIEVFIDNQYYGLYGLLERVDKKQLGLDEDDVLYKVVNWTCPSSERILQCVDREAIDIIELKHGREFSLATWEPMLRYVETIIEKKHGYDALQTANLDLSNTVDNFLYNQLVTHSDGGWKNEFFVAYNIDDTENYQMIMVPWDLNFTFGNEYTDYTPTYSVYVPEKVEVLTNINHTWNYFANSQVEGLEEALYSRWEEFKTIGLNAEGIKGMMQENMDYIVNSGALERDAVRWLECGNNMDLSILFDNIEKREAFVENYVQEFCAKEEKE